MYDVRTPGFAVRMRATIVAAGVECHAVRLQDEPRPGSQLSI